MCYAKYLFHFAVETIRAVAATGREDANEMAAEGSDAVWNNDRVFQNLPEVDILKKK